MQNEYFIATESETIYLCYPTQPVLFYNLIQVKSYFNKKTKRALCINNRITRIKRMVIIYPKLQVVLSQSKVVNDSSEEQDISGGVKTPSTLDGLGIEIEVLSSPE